MLKYQDTRSHRMRGVAVAWNIGLAVRYTCAAYSPGGGFFTEIAVGPPYTAPFKCK